MKRFQHVTPKQRHVLWHFVQQLIEEGEEVKPRIERSERQRGHPWLDLRDTLSELHPADVAYILEALPLDERLIVSGTVSGLVRTVKFLLRSMKRFVKPLLMR